MWDGVDGVEGVVQGEEEGKGRMVEWRVETYALR